MEMRLNGHHAIVCGASRGIGLASARELAALGASVTLAARDPERLKEAVQTLPVSGGQKHDFLSADFSKPSLLAQALEEYTKTTSTRFTILVNNTGGPPAGPASSALEEEFRQAFNLHLVSNHVLVRHLLPGMKAAGYGRIINVISTSVKQPLPGLGVSNTVRAAVANWAKTLANELGEFGITVNNVLPGATETERLAEIIADHAKRGNREQAQIREAMMAQVPLRRFGKPEEIAAAVAFLASPAAGYINGINLPVDGGRTACL